MTYLHHGECRQCKMPKCGRITKINHCICNNVKEIKRIEKLIKLNCVECLIEMKHDIHRYIIRGNYCSLCTAKASKHKRKKVLIKEEKTYSYYLKLTKKS